MSPLAASFAIVTLSLLRRIDEATPSSHELSSPPGAGSSGGARGRRRSHGPPAGLQKFIRNRSFRPWCHRLCTAHRLMREGDMAHACMAVSDPSYICHVLQQNTHHVLLDSLHSIATNYGSTTAGNGSPLQTFFSAHCCVQSLRTYVRAPRHSWEDEDPRGYKKSPKYVAALVRPSYVYVRAARTHH